MSRMKEPTPFAEEVRRWTCNHFSISDKEANTSRLLRKMADALDELGSVQVLDVTFSSHFDGDHLETRMSAYFAYPEDERSGPQRQSRRRTARKP